MNADISIMNHYLKPLTSVCTKNFPMMIPFTEITSKKVLLKVNLIKIGTLEENGEKHIDFATFFPDTACEGCVIVRQRKRLPPGQDIFHTFDQIFHTPIAAST